MISVFIVTGGYTGERVISLQSAQTFKQNLNKIKYEVHTIDIKPDNSWEVLDLPGAVFDFSKCAILYKGKVIKPDVTLNALHGAPGENGWLQGYLAMNNIPTTTGDTLTMSISFNKKMSIDIAGKNGCLVAHSVLLKQGTTYDVEVLAKQFEFPLFVKPNCSGSSLGISRVEKKEDLQKAIAFAFTEGKEILIESLLVGSEITCGVFRKNGNLIALPPTEIRSHNVFFDYEAKYHKASDEITPAEVPDFWIKNVQEQAKKIYELFNCRGITRVDFMVNDAGKPYLIELNCVPGMSAESLVPQQLAAANIPFTDMLDDVITEALAG